MQRHRTRFTGRVQGVGFRATTQAIASRLGLTGWVRNEPDGSVLMEAQGSAAVLPDLYAQFERVLPRHVRERRTETQGCIEGEVGFTIER